eukprot:750715-Hanusia_phi.AAC.1
MTTTSAAACDMVGFRTVNLISWVESKELPTPITSLPLARIHWPVEVMATCCISPFFTHVDMVREESARSRDTQEDEAS